MQPTPVLDANGQQVGTYQRSVDTPDGEMMLVTREERLGGGTIVVPAREVGEPDGAWHLPYGELSIREAPPYSANVALHAYFEFWKRLGAGNVNNSMAEYLPTGSGWVPSDVDVPDDRLQEGVTAALREAAGLGVYSHLVRVSVKRGTVLLEGEQNDTSGRLAAAEAAASVPGVKEIINMLVIRALY
jgi:BON domain